MTHEKIIVQTVDEPNGDMPKSLKWTLTAINRVGFPIVAFGAMTYLCFVTLNKQTESITHLNDTLMQMRASIDNNTAAVKNMVEAIYRTRSHDR